MELIQESAVFSEYGALASVISDQLRPAIVGPQAKLFRYAVAAEKALASLGSYDPSADTQYDWPGLPADATVDLDYVKVYLDSALLRYYHDSASSGSTVANVDGYPNRIRSSGVSFRENGEDYPRDDVFFDRDVQFGDRVTIRGTVDDVEYTLDTAVAGFVGEVVDDVIDTFVPDQDNADSQPAGISSDKIGGVDNCINMVPDEPSLYDGIVDGDLTETYTVEVLTSSTGGDHTTARLRVTSASGLDDASNVVPAPVGESTAIGARGLAITFSLAAGMSCSDNADEDSVSTDDLIAGQAWRITVAQAYNPSPTLSGMVAGGDYTGTSDTTYIVEVTKGGYFDNTGDASKTRPEITVTTSTGVDVSGPTVLTFSAGSGSVAIGALGLTLTFNTANGKLVKRDRYTIDVTASVAGALQTLILADNLPSALQDDSLDLDLQLFIKKNGVLVTKNRFDSAPNVNYTTAADNIVLKEGLTVTDASWTDGGVLQSLTVTSATVYVEYRAWVVDFEDRYGSISDINLVTATLGALHPDNPLAWGVYKALQQTNGTAVGFVGVPAAQDFDAWKASLDLLAYRDRVYPIAVLTNDPDIQNYAVTHVNAMSGARVNLFRSAYLSANVDSPVELASASLSTDSAVILAKLTDDPDADGTQYSYLQVTSGNVSFATLGIRAGDTVRFLYTTDGYGNEAYTEFEVGGVVSNQTLRLATGHAVAVNTPQRMEVWRTLTNDEVVSAVITRARALNNRRVCLVWPDTVSSGGLVYPGYFLCAALAGLRGNALPHRSLSRIKLNGIDAVPRTTRFLTPAQIRRLQDNGVWVVSQDRAGSVYSIEAVTTQQTVEPANRLDSMRTDSDACGFLVLEEMRAFFERFNITPESLGQALTQLNAALQFLRSHARTQELGAMLLDGAVTQFRQHSINKDQMVIGITLSLPIPYSQDVELLMEV